MYHHVINDENHEKTFTVCWKTAKVLSLEYFVLCIQYKFYKINRWVYWFRMIVTFYQSQRSLYS